MRLKKISNNQNRELQMFFEELSRIKVDVLANYENLKAVAEWSKHLENLPNETKEHLHETLQEAIKYLGTTCDIVFKESNVGIQHVLNDISQITMLNKKEKENKWF